MSFNLLGVHRMVYHGHYFYTGLRYSDCCFVNHGNENFFAEDQGTCLTHFTANFLIERYSMAIIIEEKQRYPQEDKKPTNFFRIYHV